MNKELVQQDTHSQLLKLVVQMTFMLVFAVIALDMANLFQPIQAAPEEPPPEEPPTEPPVDIGYMEGYVLNAVTGAKLPPGSAMITFDDNKITFNNYTADGGFIVYIQHGISHHFMIEADGYQTGEFDVFMPTKYDRHNFRLEPM